MALTAATLWTAAACAACPSPERVNTILRFQEMKQPLRGLRADLSMADAECGRRRLVERIEAVDNPIVGYKAGLTSRAAQERFGVASPVRGVLLEKMLLKDGADVAADFGARPAYEADLLVVVKDASIHQAKTHLDVLRSISLVIPFIELPDLLVAEGEKLSAPLIVSLNVGARPAYEADLLVVVKDASIHQAKTHLDVLRSISLVIPFIELPDLLVAEGEKLSAPLIVSLNVGARLGVVGKGIPVQATPEFAAALAAMRVVVADQKGAEIASGRGAAILDNPLNAVLWLAQELARSGIKLKAGDLLSLGSFTAPLTPRPGLAVTVRYEGLPGNPAVSVRFR